MIEDKGVIFSVGQELRISGVAVVELDILRRDTPDNRPARVLIGMDIIMEGDFALTLSENKLELFFRVPSQGLAVPI